MRLFMNSSAGRSGHFAAVSTRICCSDLASISRSQRTPVGYDLIQGMSFMFIAVLLYASVSDGGHASVDGERLAGDEGAGVGREQRGHALQVLGAAFAVHRRHRRRLVLADRL